MGRPPPLQASLFLDFLYPPQMLATISEISRLGIEKLQRRRTRKKNSRKFTSSARGNYQAIGYAVQPSFDTQYQEAESDDILVSPGWQMSPSEQQSRDEEDTFAVAQTPVAQTPETQPLNQEVETLEERIRNIPKLRNPSRTLINVLSSDTEKDNYEYAWQLFERCIEMEQEPNLKLQHELILYLSRSGDSLDSERVLDLHESLPWARRTPSVNLAALSASLNLDMLSTAVRLHHESLLSKTQEVDSISTVRTRTEISSSLLVHVLGRKLWQVASEVLKTAANLLGGAQLQVIWSNIISMPEFATTLPELIRYYKSTYVEDYPSRNDSATETLFLLVRQAVRHITLHGEFGDTFEGQNPLISILQEAAPIYPNIGNLYFEKISAIIRSPEEGQYSNRSILAPIYRRWRSLESFKPARWLLYKVLQRFADHQSTAVDLVRQDWERFHGPLDKKALRRLLDMYARMGDASKVYELFAHAQSLEMDIDHELLWPLIYVHARRAQVSQAQRQFNAVSEKYGLKPDTRCWNILIHAYARIDDYEGALRCLDDMLESQSRPDHWTVETVMSVCANRGDLEAVQDLHELAQSRGIKLTTAATDSLVLAHINSNNDFGTAEALCDEAVNSNVPGPRTHMWNMLLNNHGLKGDVETVMRLYRKMQAARVPINSLTYAALMHALVIKHQTAAAYKILRRIMPKQRVRPTAFHYAICIGGFANQRQFDMAMAVHKRMEDTGIKDTFSVKIAYMRARALMELWQSQQEGFEIERFHATEEALEQILEDTDNKEIAAKEPRYATGSTPIDQAYPERYFEALIYIYGKREAFDLVQLLFERYMQKSKELWKEDAIVPPIRMLIALMNMHLSSGEHAEVESCWDLAKSQAARLVALATPPSPPSTPAAGEDWQPSEQQEELPALPSVRRFILTRPLSYYLNSLCAQGRVGEMHSTIDNYYSLGYSMDNNTWNTYVQLLASADNIRTAFNICETNLMDAWPGWRKADSSNLTTRRMGLFYIRRNQVKPDRLVPTYRTMVEMAAALRRLRNLRIMGGRPSEDQEVPSLEELKTTAPKTWDAVVRLPRTDDELQTRLLPRA